MEQTDQASEQNTETEPQVTSVQQEANSHGALEIKKPSEYNYQAQKIMMGGAEEEAEVPSPTYKDFFEKDQKRKQPSDREGDKKIDRPPQRWELLYEKAKESRIAKEELRKESEVPKEDPECTFQPRLVSSYTKKPASTEGEIDLMPPVHERAQAWKTKRDEKRLETFETVKDKDMNDCTFKPDLAKSQARDQPTQNLSGYQSKGIDQHLRRQIIAKQTKDEKNSILENPLQKLPSHVYKKEGNITIPKGPEFNSHKTIEVHSLKKPFESPRKPQKNSANTSPNKGQSPQKESQTLVDPIHVSNVKFGQAIQMLHNELYNINIDSN